MHVRKLPSGSWHIEAYGGYNKETGRTKRKYFTGKDLKALRLRAAEWEQENRKQKADGIPLRDAAEHFLSVHAVALSPSTQQGYTAICRTLPDWLLDLSCDAVSSDDLQRYVNSLSVSPKTIRNRIGFISAVLKSQGITPPMVRTPQRQEAELHIPDSDTVRQILQAAKPVRELWVCIMLAATGPLRAGEIAALEVSDIDGTTVHVHHDLVYGADHRWHLKAPKTRSSDRFIDMPEELVAVIREQGYVTHWTPKGIYNRFRTLLRREGIEPMRFHDLRHFCISELLSQGIDEIYVAQRSGHTSHATMQRYIHALGNRRKEVSAVILSHFDDIFGQ